MNLAVTVRRDKDLPNIESLIRAVRGALAVERVTIMEAPQNFDYPYPFPVVTVDTGPNQGRYFGTDALSILKRIAKK